MVSEALASIVKWLKSLFLASLFFLFLGSVPRLVLEWTQTVLPTLAHGVVLLVFFAVLLAWAWLISGNQGKRAFSTLYQHGIKWPFLFSISLFLWAAACFASLSSTLSDLCYVRFEPAIPRGEFWRLQDFYWWHFLNTVPGLKIPETILWKLPYQYLDSLSGWILLLFKLVVIIPVIGSFKVWSEVKKEAQKKTEGEKPH